MSTAGVAMAGVIIGIVSFLLALTFACSLRRGCRNSRDNAANNAAAAAAVAALAARHPPESGYWDHDEDHEARRRRRAQEEEHGPPPRARATASIPSFTYKPSSVTKHNVTSGEETCSVCLGAFEAGETVRLLPRCLHLYHVECIDPWLDLQSTCPICRSGIDAPMDGGGLLI